MKNVITPSYTTIGDIFEKNFLFEVPKYQRYYSWESEQVDDFIKDISNIYANTSDENHIDHFFVRAWTFQSFFNTAISVFYQHFCP